MRDGDSDYERGEERVREREYIKECKSEREREEESKSEREREKERGRECSVVAVKRKLVRKL